MVPSVGLIAGKGDLPTLLIRKLISSGRRVVVITFDKASHKSLQKEAGEVYRVGLGQADRIINTLKSAKVTDVAFAGKVDKRALFENPRFDLRALSIMKKLHTRNDDSIMTAIVEELEKEGMSVLSQVGILGNLMPSSGILGKHAPSPKQREDMEFGLRMARGIAALDIGQTVIVKDGAVVAVETIEGTDETILRGGSVARKGAVVCKVSKPRQDPRFDVPTVGAGTIRTMARVKASVLAIEADATLVVDLESTVKLCNRHRIAFVAI